MSLQDYTNMTLEWNQGSIFSTNDSSQFNDQNQYDDQNVKCYLNHTPSQNEENALFEADESNNHYEMIPQIQNNDFQEDQTNITNQGPQCAGYSYASLDFEKKDEQHISEDIFVTQENQQGQNLSEFEAIFYQPYQQNNNNYQYTSGNQQNYNQHINQIPQQHNYGNYPNYEQQYCVHSSQQLYCHQNQSISQYYLINTTQQSQNFFGIQPQSNFTQSLDQKEKPTTQSYMNENQQNKLPQRKKKIVKQNKLNQEAHSETKNLFIHVVPYIQKQLLKYYPEIDQLACFSQKDNKSLSYLNSLLVEIANSKTDTEKIEFKQKCLNIIQTDVIKYARNQNEEISFYPIFKYQIGFEVIVQNPGKYNSIKQAQKVGKQILKNLF